VERGRKIRERDMHRCSICGRAEVELHVHHIVPLSKKGSNDPSNLMSVCVDCHRKLHDSVSNEFDVGVTSGFYCLNCDRFYSVEYGRENVSCEICGNMLRPWSGNKRD